MRWLLVHPGPNFSVADVHNGWAEALRGLGEDVIEYNLDRRLTYHDAALVETGVFDDDGHPQVRKLVTRDQAIGMAAEGILAICWSAWPDVIVCTSAFFTPPEVLDAIRRRGRALSPRSHRIVMLYTESPYQDEMQLKMAEYADLCLLNDPVNIGAYRAIAPAEYMPHAYRPALHHPGPAVPDMVCDLGFVGTGFPSRIEWFEQFLIGWQKGSGRGSIAARPASRQGHRDPSLIPAGTPHDLDLILAGNWLGLAALESPLLRYVAHETDRCLDNEQAADLYRSAKAGINIYRRESEDEHAGEGWAMGPREVEMAASGLFFLRDPRPEGDGLLPMLPVFTSPGQASDLLRWYLAHPAEREKRAAAARAAVAGRTFENNARKLLRLLDRQPVRM